MLQIYPVVLDVIRKLRPVMAVIDRKDRDLGRQLRRCSSSVGLNLGEGMYSRGRNRAAKYHVALGSAREMTRFVTTLGSPQWGIPGGVLSCLEVAEAFGYIGPVDAGTRGEFDRIIGTLVRLVERAGSARARVASPRGLLSPCSLPSCSRR
jgi:hypothetical protein